MTNEVGQYAGIATSTVDYAVCEFMESFLAQAHPAREVREPDWEEQWSNYIVEPYYHNTVADRQLDPYNYDQRRNSVQELKTTESHQIANTLTSAILASLFGVRNYVQADGTGREDVDAGSRLSQLIMYGLERPGNYRTNYAALKDAIIFGTGFYKAGWETRLRTVPRRIPMAGPDGQPLIDPATGQPIYIMQNVTVPVYDDIRLYETSIYDIWFDPSASRLADASGAMERFRITADDLARMAQNPTWDADGIRDVLTMTKPGGRKPVGPGTDTQPKLLLDSLSEDDVRGIAAHGYYGGWEYNGILPSEIALRLGLDPLATAKLVTINGRVCQKAQSPQRNGELPYGSFTILPTGASLYGLSPLHVIRYLQDVSDTQMILTVQAAIESVYQNYVVGGAAAVGPTFNRNLERRKPREVFSVPGDITQIAPLVKDYTGLQLATQSLGMLSDVMRNASNARDPVQGIAAKQDTTATETNTVTAAAMQNVDQLSVLIERDELPRQGSLVHGLYYVNLPDEGAVVKRVGDQLTTQVTFADIDADYDISFVGARQAISRQQKANDFREFVQLMMANPMGAASLDFEQAALWFADNALNTRGLEKLIISDPNEVVARMQIMGLKPPSGSPQAPPGSETGGKAGPPD